VLQRIHVLLGQEPYKSLRDQYIPGAKNRVVGVYVGWRGESLPGNFDYATFFDRRDAAVRVGHGDVPELFTRLAKIQGLHNKNGKDFTTLITVGHSFGGQVVFSAVSDLLKARIADATEVVPHPPGSGPLPMLHGFGDLVLLVNPAQEASIYESIHDLMRNETFSEEQAPILMTISSEGDWPNRRFFPFGRTLGVRHEPYGTPEQYRAKTRSHGNYAPHLTHCLFVTGGVPCKGLPPPPPSIGPQNFDLRLANAARYGATSLYPLAPIDPNNPFLVVKATRDVIPGHNDMFAQPLIEFVAEFVGLAQLKRLINPTARGVY